MPARRRPPDLRPLAVPVLPVLAEVDDGRSPRRRASCSTCAVGVRHRAAYRRSEMRRQSEAAHRPQTIRGSGGPAQVVGHPRGGGGSLVEGAPGAKLELTGPAGGRGAGRGTCRKNVPHRQDAEDSPGIPAFCRNFSDASAGRSPGPRILPRLVGDACRRVVELAQEMAPGGGCAAARARPPAGRRRRAPSRARPTSYRTPTATRKRLLVALLRPSGRTTRCSARRRASRRAAPACAGCSTRWTAPPTSCTASPPGRWSVAVEDAEGLRPGVVLDPAAARRSSPFAAAARG